jgi:hypothetical protein
MDDFDLSVKCNWLVSHPNVAKGFISAFYGLNSTMLKAYGQSLNWQAITVNESISWAFDDIKKFKNKLFIGGEDYKNEWDDLVLECSDNPTVPWSEDLLELFNYDFY